MTTRIARTYAPGRVGTRAALAAAALLWCAVGAAGPGAPSAWAAEEAAKKCVEPEAVYLGDAREWSKPCEVDADAVYAEIAEYKDIVAQGLQPSDAKYGVLMSKARRKFVAAIRAAAKDGGYDLVARVGSVKGCDNVPVITSEAIAKL